MATIELEEYRSRFRRLRWPLYTVLFGTLIVGMGGALWLTQALAESSSWNREFVFAAMLPTLLAPSMLAAAFTEKLDRRIGIRCGCGQSLSYGYHVAKLLREGGDCPECGETVVTKKFV